MNLEHSLYDMHNRLARAEEGNVALNSRCQSMAEGLVKCYHVCLSPLTRASPLANTVTSGLILSLDSFRLLFLKEKAHFTMTVRNAFLTQVEYLLTIPSVSNMQREVEKHLEAVRAMDNAPDSLMPPRQPYFGNLPVESGPPLSPRQLPQDDGRRQSMMDPSRSTMIRPPVPPHLAVSPRRYGSIGGANAPPSYNRPQAPPVAAQQPAPHPLSIATPPGPLGRRHTFADIRQHDWPPSGASPFPPGNTGSGPWLSPPSRAPASSDQQVRDVLAQYEMGAPRRLQDQSRHATPPAHAEPSPSMLSTDNGWSLAGSRYPRQESSLPATRRSSMASNVHSLLNPADTAERPDEDQQDDRKRKRLE